MAGAVSADWQLFIDQYPQFLKLQRALAQTDWFVEEGWALFIGHYQAGIYAQVYKPHWFNQTQDGIHFETGLGAEQVAAKETSIDLHIGHRNLFDRQRFNQITVPRMAEVVAGWGEKYRFSETNLSQRIGVNVAFTKTGFAGQLTREFTRLCSLGAVIDEGLRQL